MEVFLFGILISMIGRTHDLAAITALGVILIALPGLQPLNLSTLLVAIFANQIGGITPDIDQPTAPFWRNLPIGGIFGKVIGRLLGGHRFLTHSILGIVLFGWLSWTFLTFLSPILTSIDIWIVWIAFMIGMLSHLIMDSFTKEGVPWLLPIPVKFGFPPIRRLRMTTGKWIENLIVLPMLIIFNIWYIALHYSELRDLLHGLM
jgi:inner membrane protein